MTIHGFKEKQVAERLRRIATPMGQRNGEPANEYYKSAIFKTPEAGIPARSSLTCGRGEGCIRYRISVNPDTLVGTLAKDLDNGEDILEDVYNWTTAEIAGNTFIKAHLEWDGVWSIGSEDCG
jgi:hypothetical protein